MENLHLLTKCLRSLAKKSDPPVTFARKSIEMEAVFEILLIYLVYYSLHKSTNIVHLKE